MVGSIFGRRRTNAADEGPETQAKDCVLDEVGLSGADEGRALPQAPVVVG